MANDIKFVMTIAAVSHYAELKTGHRSYPLRNEGRVRWTVPSLPQERLEKGLSFHFSRRDKITVAYVIENI